MRPRVVRPSGFDSGPKNGPPFRASTQRRKDDIAGLAVASDERTEAYLLYYMKCGLEIASPRTLMADGGAGLRQLLSRLLARDMGKFKYPKVRPTEISEELLETLGFRPAGTHLLYATKARSD
jgi:hypothetical protein